MISTRIPHHITHLHSRYYDLVYWRHGELITVLLFPAFVQTCKTKIEKRYNVWIRIKIYMIYIMHQIWHKYRFRDIEIGCRPGRMYRVPTEITRRRNYSHKLDIWLDNNSIYHRNSVNLGHKDRSIIDMYSILL